MQQLRQGNSEKGRQNGHQEPPSITIPYIAGVSEEVHVRRVCWDYDVRVAFKTGRTLRSKLTRVKDPLPLEKQAMVVYRIPCSYGKVYIGKTIRRMELRLKEHKDACSRGNGKSQPLPNMPGDTTTTFIVMMLQ